MGNRLYSRRFKPKPGKASKLKPKAFKSEESAKKWAEANNLKGYKLKNLSGEGNKKKIKIVTV